MLNKVSVTCCIEWRWGTLHDNMVAVEKARGALRQFFQASTIAKLKVSVNVQRVVEALDSDQWHRLFDVVMWICEWLVTILRWIGGCDCKDCPDPKTCKFRG